MKKTLVIIGLLTFVYICLFAGQEKTPENLGIHWPHLSMDLKRSLIRSGLSESIPQRVGLQKASDSVMSRSKIVPNSDHGENFVNPKSVIRLSEKVTVGESFIDEQFSSEYNISKITRAVTEENLERKLFGTPGQTASYFKIRYLKEAPFVSATYIQFVTDPLWNRMIYGNMENWIRSYDNLNQPTAIEVDPDGRIYIVEEKNSQITILKIIGSDQNVQLKELYVVQDITNPSDIAYDDNGTPLEKSDDHLFVSSGTKNKIYKLKVSDSKAEIIKTYDGFDTPTEVQIGRWDGVNNGLIYVVDKMARRLQVWEELEDVPSLTLLKTFNGDYHQYFSDLETDHFGNIYLVDKVNSEIFKLTADLEVLDSYGGEESFNSLCAIEVPFGKIEIEGEETIWAGFDQIFALEKWSDQSGAQRKRLGIKVIDFSLGSDEDFRNINASFTLTDFSTATYRVFNLNNDIVYQIEDSMLTSGVKDFIWDRKDKNNIYASPGNYRFDLEATSPYSGEKITSSTKIYLPLYYWQDCGQGTKEEDPYLVQGTPVTWGSNTGIEHIDQVVYKFDGLDSYRSYELAIECYAGDNQDRQQNVTVNGVEIIESFEVTSKTKRIGYVQLPEDSFSDGDLKVSINSLDVGSAVLSQIWIKEKTDNYQAEQVNTITPEKHFLYQNFPNPFNPVTTINFELPERQFVNMAVYDVLGQKVRTIVNEIKNAGRHTTTFDVQDLASGLYIYQIRAGNFIQTRKMLILK
jgi:hypothetical protein